VTQQKAKELNVNETIITSTRFRPKITPDILYFKVELMLTGSTILSKNSFYKLNFT